ncbi:MAG: hypothetical protein ACOYL1_04225 [Chlamydiia bacterium]
MLRWLLLLLFIPLFGFSLKEKCQQGAKGDFVLYQQGNQLVYISIYDRLEKSIVFEEIHTSDTNKELHLETPSEWVRSGAKGATQWILYELDLDTGEVLESYCPPKRAFITFDQDPPIISKLFTISWDQMPDNRRKHLPKTNKIWSPPKKVSNTLVAMEQSTLFRYYWPKDGSFLSELRVDLHLDPNTAETFPYMVDIQNKIRPLARFHQIDQGKKGASFVRYFPRRHPEFQIGIRQKGDIISTTLHCSKGFFPFSISLEEVESKNKHPLTFESEKKGDVYLLKLEIPKHLTTKGKTFRLLGETSGIHRSRFDSIEVFELN